MTTLTLEKFIEDNPDMAPEPPPVNLGVDVWLEAIEYAEFSLVGLSLINVMRKRREFGIAKYGQPLMSDDGRNTLKDMLDEALDGYAYATKKCLQNIDCMLSRRLRKLALEYLERLYAIYLDEGTNA